jgi:3-oxoacyl-[acyl-carrier protein] reductase
MNLELTGMRALITGSSSGIGESIAVALADEGAKVTVHGRRESEIERVTGRINSSGGVACGVAGDLRIDDDAQRVVDAAVSAYGGVDVLVNNAGGYDLESSWHTTSAQAWLDRFDEHVGAAVRMITRVLPGMVDAGWGRIINVSSTAAAAPGAGIPDYGASKSALSNLTASLALSCVDTGVTVNAIVPGVVLTAGMRAAMDEIAASRDWPETGDDRLARGLREVHGDPPGGWGDPRELADAVAWVASPRARWMTGASLRIDGGKAAVPH